MLFPFNIHQLSQDPRIRYTFRKPLKRGEFREFRHQGKTLGFFYAGLKAEKNCLDTACLKKKEKNLAILFIRFPFNPRSRVRMFYDELKNGNGILERAESFLRKIFHQSRNDVNLC